MRDYQTKQNKGGLPDSINLENFGAGEFNSIAQELENAATSAGLTIAPADGTGEVLTQLGQSLAIYGAGGGGYHKDTGAVNAYVLNPVSPKKSPPAYFDGFAVVFKPGSDNTGASTVNIASIGVKSITDIGGNALTGDEISGMAKIRYNLADDRFEIESITGFMRTVIITTTGTYVKPSGLKFIIGEGVAGGGGSGGCSTTGAGEAAGSRGGSAGGYAKKLILASALSASETITIGAAGAAGAGGGAGSNGGTTSLGSHFTCNGGSGSGIGNDISGNAASAAIAGGTSTGGDININGDPSIGVAIVAGVRASISNGASSPLGTGGHATVGSTGGVGTGYGAGGGGGSLGASAGSIPGAVGSQGVIIITEFF